MACDLIAVLKSCELILCIICLVYRIWTEWETLQVFYKLEKQSREWPLATNFVRDRRNAIFSEITLGAYVIICAGLLIGHVKGELYNARATEAFFLVLGTLLFLIVGGISLTTVDDVPHQLVVNGIVLGILTILTAILFLLDIGLTRKQTGQSDSKHKKVLIKPQKQINPKSPDKNSTASAEKIDEVDKGKPKKKGVLTELRSSLKKRNAEDIGGRGVVVEKNVDFQERPRNGSERQTRQEETPPQVGRRNMENRGFPQKHQDEEDAISRRSLDPEDFERSFTKVERTSNGYLKNDDRQYTINSRDDERSYPRSHHDEPFVRIPDRQSERYSRQDSRYYDERQNFPKANGYIRREHSREDDRHSTGYYRQDDRSQEYARPIKERRHSFDYIQKEDRRVEPFRGDDHFRRGDDLRSSQLVRTADSPRNYRKKDEDFRDRDLEFDDLRKPVYVEDRRSYRGYSDTVKYLEKQTTEKRREVDEDNDAAMPPKHVIEVEMDDHFYRPSGGTGNGGEAPDIRRINAKRHDGRDATLQVAKVTSSQRNGHNGSSDDSELIPQIPSVSFLLSERGRKVMPSLSASPVERVERVSTPKYYFADPSSPGYVKQQASNWPSPSPVNSQAQSSRSAP